LEIRKLKIIVPAGSQLFPQFCSLQLSHYTECAKGFHLTYCVSSMDDPNR